MNPEDQKLEFVDTVTLKQMYDRLKRAERGVWIGYALLTALTTAALISFQVTKIYLVPAAMKTAIQDGIKDETNVKLIAEAQKTTNEYRTSAYIASSQAQTLLVKMQSDFDARENAWKVLTKKLDHANAALITAVQKSTEATTEAKANMIVIANVNSSEMYDVTMRMSELRESPARPFESEEIATKLANVAGYRFGVFTPDHKLLMIGRGDQYTTNEIDVRDKLLAFKKRVEKELQDRKHGAPHKDISTI